MLNFVWTAMIFASVVFGCVSGNIAQTAQGAFEGANDAVSVVIGFTGITVFWSGLMRIAERSGLTEKISALIKPIIRIIFPKLKNEKKAQEAVAANMVANMLGLSNAATPLGIKAMNELDKINGYKKKASDAMCMLAVVNSASIQIIPATVIGIRSSLGSACPSDIIVPVWIVSVLTATFGICMAKIFERTGNFGREK